MTHISDEILNAMIDDEMDLNESQAIRAQISKDPVLQKKVDDLLTLKYMVQSTRWGEVSDDAPVLPIRKSCVSVKSAAIAAMLLAVVSSTGIYSWKSFQTPKAALVAAAQAEQPLTRVLLHFSSDSYAEAEQLLDQTEYLLTDYQERGEPVRIEVIENGHDLRMLRDDSPFATRIREIKSKYHNVNFAACLSTKSSLEAELGHSIRLLPEAGVVDSGVAKIMELQKEGWMYIRG